MSLKGLVYRVESLRSRSTETERLPDRELARQALIQEFGVEPTAAEVAELASAVEAVYQRKAAENAFWTVTEDDEHDERERQTRGGREVIRKSEHRAG